ncbi:hypothetical protein Pla123a_29960 [Posidoniimonas polymericola]|uniref:Uncharacterized protein n=1 Tax=Posidoniimonas polymericola TaxID=2528002 RepID=A0A5C5YKW0_9BACT|nr:hypothetical protein [Posidoniimonas polymericola]TWT75487.1 hypothetical protein Pla123a_29960 [Posidoniimonas polymericola]
MKLNPLLLAFSAVVLLSGCAVGLPRGPIEPSITADCVAYLNENWIEPLQGPSDHYAKAPAPQPAKAAPRRRSAQVAVTSASEELAPPRPMPAAEPPMVQRPLASPPLSEEHLSSACAPCEHGPPCHDCPLIPNVSLPRGAPQPMYVDPGPPGRFLPVPVRPVFEPRPEMGYYGAMPPPY